MSELSAKDLQRIYSSSATPDEVQTAHDNLTALISRVDTAKPAPSDVEALRTALRQGAVHYVAALGSRSLIKELVNAMAPSEVTRAVAIAEVEELRDSLGYRKGSAVERALIDHIGVCWARLQLAEHVLSSVTSGQHALSDGRYREMRVTEAQTRYLRALALLERLRRYAPNVQINIANQQVVQGLG